MAKIIETQDGARMLVSDDAPDDIVSTDQWVKPALTPSESLVPTIDPVSILLCFAEETFPIVPIQANTFLVKSDMFKLSGAMLLSDYAWMLANVKAKLSHMEIRNEHRSYKIAQGPLSIARFLGKDINASTVDVNVSFKRDI